jgi:regulator of sirC expression with transglutaminase-like and TPR domain
MLNNLCASAAAQRDDDRLLRYLDAALAVDPDAASQRLQRLLVHAKNGRRPEALADAAWIMEHQPPGIDLDRLRDLTNTLEQRP